MTRGVRGGRGHLGGHALKSGTILNGSNGVEGAKEADGGMTKRVSGG